MFELSNFSQAKIYTCFLFQQKQIHNRNNDYKFYKCLNYGIFLKLKTILVSCFNKKKMHFIVEFVDYKTIFELVAENVLEYNEMRRIGMK